MNLTSAVRTAKSVITANSPVLLAGAAVAGVVTTGILAAKGGYKARGIIDAKYAEMDSQGTSRPLKNSEKFQLTWLCYAAPAVTALSTIASVAGVHLIHSKRNAALMGMYAVATGKLDDMREEAEKLLGSKKTQQLNDAIGQKVVDRNPLSEHDINEVLITDDGSELFYEDVSGRYFYSSVAAIEKAIGEINVQLARDGDATLNELYDKLGLPEVQVGGMLGWSGKGVEPSYGAVKSSDGRAAISLFFLESPKFLNGKVKR